MSWQQRAACDGLPGSWFFEDIFRELEDGTPIPIDKGALKRARDICATCPVRVECHLSRMAEEGGSRQSRRFGLWGGLTPSQRYSVWRRDVIRCEQCNEAYDPLGLAAGEIVCDCGSFTEPPIPDEGDLWYPRHDGLLAKLTEHLLTQTAPGDRIPPPYRMLTVLGHRRKDDMPLVYERLIEDGLIEKGEGRGVYYRRAGHGVLTRYRPWKKQRPGTYPRRAASPRA